jgi:phosphate uptake regulator
MNMKENSMWTELIKLWKADNLLKQALDQSYEMLEMAHDMFKKAVESLRHTDTEVDEETRKKDKMINQYEREVRRKVLTHLSVMGTADLPAGLVLVTIIIDIERIGDYIKNILDLANLHVPKLDNPEFVKDMEEVEKAVEKLFSRTLECLKNSDEDLALELMSENKLLGKQCEEVIQDLIKNQKDQLPTSDAVSLALYFRYLKRINAHLKNITSSVVNPFDRIGYKYKGDTPK